VKKRVYWQQIITTSEKQRVEQTFEEEGIDNLKIKNFPFEDETIRKISLVNPVQDFKRMITNKKED
jgi:hypothetical protein